jgi:hypothetical protein
MESGLVVEAVEVDVGHVSGTGGETGAGVSAM